jgi:uncharacterized phage-associated protein
MTIHARLFDRDKAIEATLFIASLSVNPTKHSISKMFYLADKLHLQEYGRLICGDRYIAMEYGPVPSAIYDMMKVSEGQARIDPDIDDFILAAFSVTNGRCVVPKRTAETAFLSESEIECIQATLLKYGDKTFGELTDITHDEAWKITEDNQPISLLNIAKTLPNAAELIAYFEAH